jgi:hypothetical protein
MSWQLRRQERGLVAIRRRAAHLLLSVSNNNPTVQLLPLDANVHPYHE